MSTIAASDVGCAVFKRDLVSNDLRVSSNTMRTIRPGSFRISCPRDNRLSFSDLPSSKIEFAIHVLLRQDTV